MIYRGILAISRDESVRDFAARHIATERDHLRLMEETVPPSARTRLLPLWWVMGWLTGALPAVFGRHAVFATIEAVETFVDHHYRQQIDHLAGAGTLRIAQAVATAVPGRRNQPSRRSRGSRRASSGGSNAALVYHRRCRICSSGDRCSPDLTAPSPGSCRGALTVERASRPILLGEDVDQLLSALRLRFMRYSVRSLPETVCFCSMSNISPKMRSKPDSV